MAARCVSTRPRTRAAPAAAAAIRAARASATNYGNRKSDLSLIEDEKAADGEHSSSVRRLPSSVTDPCGLVCSHGFARCSLQSTTFACETSWPYGDWLVS